MGIWKMDLDMAHYLIEHWEDIPVDTSFMYRECACCGASYLDRLGHTCGNSIDLKTEDRKVVDIGLGEKKPKIVAGLFK